MTALVVDRCGPGATVQDGGRIGWRRYGVATAGAMDRLALAVANALVGNAPATAAIELTLAGARFVVSGGAMLVAAAGPGVVLAVAGRKVVPGTSARADPGEVIDVSAPRDGVHGYVAVAGGFDLPAQMGSLSGHLRSGIGVPSLRPGQRLAVAGGALLPLALDRVSDHAAGPIRAMAGPQEGWFGPDALAMLEQAEWQVDPRSDRMGRFLAGPALIPRAGSMVSDGVLPGSIQCPPSGQPIILMRDCQTTGGYPKIATVISADLDRLAQLPAGARFRLELIDRATAVAAAARFAAGIAALCPRPAGGLDAGRLLTLNLIGGVVDGRAEG